MSRAPYFGLCISISLIASSCNWQEQDVQALFYREDNAKPVVAIVPVINRANCDVSWNLSDELTYSIFHRLSQKDNLYLADIDKIRANIKKLKDSNNPFGTDLSWVKHAFAKNEFVIFLELIEHQEVPITSSAKSSLPEDLPAELNMTMRVRIVDLTTGEPKVILQELVHDSHYIPRQFNKANFYQVEWGNESFAISPMGLAHIELTKEICKRIEDYVLLAKSK